MHQKEWKLNFNQKFIVKISLLEEYIIFDIFLKLYVSVEGFLNFTPGKFNSLKAC
jgi:hypothetical protein